MTRKSFLAYVGAGLASVAASGPALRFVRDHDAERPLRSARADDADPPPPSARAEETSGAGPQGPDAGDDPFPPIEKSKDEWREILPEDRFRILFKEKTEPAFSSPLDREKREGTYICAACFLPLFTSGTKYDSGTGWPSFWTPIEGRVGTKRDFKLLIPRTEYHCIRCEGHQGHVFNDGPPPTGRRWCNNGLALEFVPEGEPLPELRT